MGNMIDIEAFVRDPKNIKDPIDLTVEIENQCIEVRYHAANERIDAAKAKSEFVLKLARRLDELLGNPEEIEIEK